MTSPGPHPRPIVLAKGLLVLAAIGWVPCAHSGPVLPGMCEDIFSGVVIGPADQLREQFERDFATTRLSHLEDLYPEIFLERGPPDRRMRKVPLRGAKSEDNPEVKPTRQGVENLMGWQSELPPEWSGPNEVVGRSGPMRALLVRNARKGTARVVSGSPVIRVTNLIPRLVDVVDSKGRSIEFMPGERLDRIALLSVEAKIREIRRQILLESGLGSDQWTGPGLQTSRVDALVRHVHNLRLALDQRMDSGDYWQFEVLETRSGSVQKIFGVLRRSSQVLGEPSSVFLEADSGERYVLGPGRHILSAKWAY